MTAATEADNTWRALTLSDTVLSAYINACGPSNNPMRSTIILIHRCRDLLTLNNSTKITQPIRRARAWHPSSHPPESKFLIKLME